MPRLSTFNYNYRVTKYDKQNDKYVKIYDKLFSQLKDIQVDFPQLSVKDIQYIARHDSIARLSDKYKGISIKKIYPILIDGL